MTFRFRLLLSASVLATSLLGACGSSDAPGAPASLPPEAISKANEIYVQRCTPCHGASGHGDGTASGTLDPKPRNFSDPTWQKSVTDDYIAKIIKVGGAGVGKSAAMPSNPDLRNADVIAALRAKVRSFAGK